MGEPEWRHLQDFQFAGVLGEFPGLNFDGAVEYAKNRGANETRVNYPVGFLRVCFRDFQRQNAPRPSPGGWSGEDPLFENPLVEDAWKIVNG